MTRARVREARLLWQTTRPLRWGSAPSLEMPTVIRCFSFTAPSACGTVAILPGVLGLHLVGVTDVTAAAHDGSRQFFVL